MLALVPFLISAALIYAGAHYLVALAIGWFILAMIVRGLTAAD
jgi:hypothetical protein